MSFLKAIKKIFSKDHIEDTEYYWTKSSQEKVDLFYEACELANTQKYKEALKVYIDVFSFDEMNELKWLGNVKPRKNSGKKLIIDSELMGLTEIYKADCLRNMNMLEEAKNKLQDEKTVDIVSRFSDLAHLYQYFFIFGHVLGGLKNVRGMDEQFSKAFEVACDDLKEVDKAIDCLIKKALRRFKWIPRYFALEKPRGKSC